MHDLLAYGLIMTAFALACPVFALRPSFPTAESDRGAACKRWELFGCGVLVAPCLISQDTLRSLQTGYLIVSNIHLEGNFWGVCINYLPQCQNLATFEVLEQLVLFVDFLEDHPAGAGWSIFLKSRGVAAPPTDQSRLYFESEAFGAPWRDC
jgi:hypothetical protein